MTAQDDQQAIKVIGEQVSQCFDKADAFFKGHFKRPSFNVKQRGKAAGTAYLERNELRFNLYMYHQDPGKFLRTVVPHEVAHLVVYQIYQHHASAHGKEWRAVMEKVFSVPAERTHDFKVKPPKQSFHYICNCQTHIFTRQRHNRAQSGTQYRCKLCQQCLEFQSEQLRDQSH